MPDARANGLTGDSAPATPRGHGREYVRALEATARTIRNPVVKLRFLRGSLGRHHGFDRFVPYFPFATLRRGLYRWLSLEVLRQVLSENALGTNPIKVPAASQRALLAARLGVAISAASLLAFLAGAGYMALRPSAAAPVLADAHPAPTPSAEPPEPEPRLPAAHGLAPEDIWIVESGDGHELLSNGLRIDTRFAVKGEPRAYRVFDRATGRLGAELIEQPRGILFHTSESDIFPLEPGFNDDLKDGTHRLLRYLARNQVYHYLIDRFGRVFRVVDEADRANHAGYSVWASGDEVYLSLNDAFVAISFESRWEGGLTLPITRAQYASGKNLSDWLRQRHAIAPEMCVAHGLASVNPRKHLIGHHLDWSRGFPFQEFGLPDQYGTPAPAVELFGFAWDETLIEALGEPWPGARAAERTLQQAALDARKDLWDFRLERQRLYDEWIAEQSRDEEHRAAGAGGAASRAERARTAGPSGG